MRQALPSETAPAGEPAAARRSGPDGQPRTQRVSCKQGPGRVGSEGAGETATPPRPPALRGHVSPSRWGPERRSTRGSRSSLPLSLPAAPGPGPRADVGHHPAGQACFQGRVAWRPQRGQGRKWPCIAQAQGGAKRRRSPEKVSSWFHSPGGPDLSLQGVPFKVPWNILGALRLRDRNPL